MSGRLLWVCGLVGAMALGACGPGMDEKSGGDESRGAAKEVKLDEPFDDRVSAEEGDHTDWKTFNLEGQTSVFFQIWWDNKNVDAAVSVRDQFGAVQGQLTHRKGQRKDILGPIVLGEGAWFIEIKAKEGSSVYTMELRTKAAQKTKSGGDDKPDF